MAFKLPKKARSYFDFSDYKTSPSKIFFDRYYLCLLAGLKEYEIGNTQDLEPEDFVGNYPEDYKDKKNIIAGLLIVAEMKRKSISTDHKESLEKLMKELLAYNDNFLTNEGINQLNLYAVKGMEYIAAEIPRPETFSEFLVTYYKWMSNS